MRGALAAALVVGSVVLASPVEGAPSLEVTLGCDRPEAPGRVVCALELSAPPGAELVWADALVLATPDFARPLRARATAPAGAVGRALRVPFALLLERAGRGLVRVRGRAVSCSRSAAGERCTPETRDVELVLDVR